MTFTQLSIKRYILLIFKFFFFNLLKSFNFHDGPVVKNLAASAPVQTSLWATTTEPVLCNRGSHCNEQPMHSI